MADEKVQRYNPAARLEWLIAHAAPDSNRLGAQVWASVIGLKSEDQEDQFYAAYLMVNLVNELESALKQPGQTIFQFERFTPMLGHLRELLKHSIVFSPWSNTQDRIKAGSIMPFLGFASDALDSISPEVRLSSSDYGDILKSIQDLRVALGAADIPVDLRSSLEEMVNAMERATRSYATSGVKALSRSLELLIGSIVLHADQLRQPGSAALMESAKSAFMKIYGALRRLVPWAVRVLGEGKLGELSRLLPPFVP